MGVQLSRRLAFSLLNSGHQDCDELSSCIALHNGLSCSRGIQPLSGEHPCRQVWVLAGFRFCVGS
jgi:hypothetical protein